MSRPKKERAKCKLEGCDNSVKLTRNEYCSLSCAATDRWITNPSWRQYMVDCGRNTLRNMRVQNMKERIHKVCKELEIELTPAISRLFVRAHSQGYTNGYTAGVKKMRRLSNGN